MGSAPGRTVLLLIDIQEGLTYPNTWGTARSNPSFESNAESLLKAYRSLVSTSSAVSASPHMIVHIAHSSVEDDSPLRPTQPGFAFQSFATPLPSERVIEKNVNSAFIGTDLEKVLRGHFGEEAGTLYIIGLTTDHCVSTTTRMAGNLRVANAPSGQKGEVILIEDATAAWKKTEDGFDAEVVHKVNIESLRNEFATIEKTQNVLEIWKGWVGK